jgi:flavodoxin
MKNKNVSIYVFSGTGNTLLIANKIAENLIKDASCACEVFRMESTDPKA